MRHEDQIEHYDCPLCGQGIGNDVDGCVEHECEEEKKMKVISGEELVENWKAANFPPVPKNEEWEELKHHVCKEGDALNPILLASGGEIQVEQFGIIGWLDKVKMHESCEAEGEHFLQCSLLEARETGTGRFGEWLENVKKFCMEEHGMHFALHNITNQGLYKYCIKHNVYVSTDDGMLCNVQVAE